MGMRIDTEVVSGRVTMNTLVVHRTYCASEVVSPPSDAFQTVPVFLFVKLALPLKGAFVSPKFESENAWFRLTVYR